MATSTAVQKLNIVSTQPPRLLNTVTCLIAADIVTLLISVAISLMFKSMLTGIQKWDTYLHLWPFLFVFIAVYALVGLYSGIALSPPEELRRATLSSALIFVILGAATVSLRGANHYFTWTMLLALVLSVVLLPLLRGFTRQCLSRQPWWGSPAVIFGAGETGRHIIKTLQEQPGLGLKPVAVMDDDPDAPHSIRGVPVMNGFELADAAPDSHKFAYAVMAMPGVPNSSFQSMIETYGLHFSRILMIPNLTNFCSLWVSPKSVGGMLGLEVCQQAMVRERQLPKRALDLGLTLLGGALILPLIVLIALWVKIDSPGPVFYSQKRIGQDGNEFHAWKFRSMVHDADRVLQGMLKKDPKLREEWEATHKLKNDPRVSPSGRFLRRTSLDELPQLWNVLRGDMSLVGPRPIVHAEISKYGDTFDLYMKVKSGITGLWQISGRNDTSYAERVTLDAFYVRNWSVWLDFYILFRTIETVVLRKGAY